VRPLAMSVVRLKGPFHRLASCVSSRAAPPGAPVRAELSSLRSPLLCCQTEHRPARPPLAPNLVGLRRSVLASACARVPSSMLLRYPEKGLFHRC
jgi:hypothetical protein